MTFEPGVEDSISVVVARGLNFPEAPRWRDGFLWFSDILNSRVVRVAPGGDLEIVADLDSYPCGLGFLPDGTLLVASMQRRQILRHTAGRFSVHADLSAVTDEILNDMLVTDTGTAYVGTRRADVGDADAGGGGDVLIRVDPNGSHSVAATDLAAPNGIAVIGDKLIVAETMAQRLTQFTVGSHGELSDRQVFVDLGDEVPDGICADGSGGIWIASIASGDFLRVDAHGDITDRVPSGGVAIACALGGQEGRTLYMASLAREALQYSWSESERRYIAASADVPIDSGVIRATTVRYPA